MLLLRRFIVGTIVAGAGIFAIIGFVLAVFAFAEFLLYSLSLNPVIVMILFVSVAIGAIYALIMRMFERGN